MKDTTNRSAFQEIDRKEDPLNEIQETVFKKKPQPQNNKLYYENPYREYTEERSYDNRPDWERSYKKQPPGERRYSYTIDEEDADFGFEEQPRIFNRRESASVRKEKRTANKKALKIMALLLLVGAVIALFVFLPRANNIAVSGVRDISKAEVISLSGIKQGSHLFGIDRERIAEGIAKNPYFCLEDISYTFPDGIELVVKERKVGGYFAFVDSFLLVSDDGVILEVAKEKPSSALIEGLVVRDYTAGNHLETEDSYKEAVLEDIFENLRKNDFSEEITKIDLSNISSILLETKEQITVSLGDGDKIPEKINWAAAVYPKIVKDKGETGVLDVSTGEEAAYHATTQPIELIDPTSEIADEDTTGDILDDTADSAIGDTETEADIAQETGEEQTLADDTQAALTE